MAKVTECPICLERYNIQNKIPKILHCGHTFCQECLINSKKISENELCCSICRKKELFEEIDDLSTNRVIYDLLYNPTQEENLVEEKYKFKIIIIGSAFTGKTSLLNRYIKNMFNNEYNVTLGADIQYQKIKIGDKSISLQLWDTAGTERFQSIQKMYYLKSYAALIVFDVGNRSSFDSVLSWMDHYKQFKDKNLKEIIYLIGNKIDIEKREVSKEEAQEFSRIYNLKYYEASAKNGDNIELIFNDLAQELVNTYKGGNIYTINAKENNIEQLDVKAHLQNENCWDKFVNNIKKYIFFWNKS